MYKFTLYQVVSVKIVALNLLRDKVNACQAKSEIEINITIHPKEIHNTKLTERMENFITIKLCTSFYK